MTDPTEPTGAPAEPPPVVAHDDPSTVGTGSAVAIGCTVVVLVMTLLGVLILVLTRWI